jgi:hypothetical protein
MSRRRFRKRSRKAPLAINKEEKCVSKWCRNRRAAKITRYKSPSGKIIVYNGFLRHCWKCKSRQMLERHPVTYVLNMLRNRAKQRGVPFTITLSDFKNWCLATNYISLRGRKPNSATIDRVNHDEGYHIWNIQIKSFMENCTNGHTVPDRECKQNESADYDLNSPEPEYVSPVNDNEPF